MKKNILRLICAGVMLSSGIGFANSYDASEDHGFRTDRVGMHEHKTVPLNGSSAIVSVPVALSIAFGAALFSLIYLECNMRE